MKDWTGYYKYECAYCVEIQGYGHWSQWYVDTFHNGSLERLQLAHQGSRVHNADKHVITEAE